MKRLEIEVMKTPWGPIGRVVVQTHKDYEFGNCGNSFAHNGLTITSCYMPAFSVGCSTLFVRGTKEAYDNKIFVIPDDETLSHIRECVRAYNEYFSGKEIPESGDTEQKCQYPVEVLR